MKARLPQPVRLQRVDGLHLAIMPAGMDGVIGAARDRAGVVEVINVGHQRSVREDGRVQVVWRYFTPYGGHNHF